MENLFPMVLTDCAAANDEINNAKLMSIFFLVFLDTILAFIYGLSLLKDVEERIKELEFEKKHIELQTKNNIYEKKIYVNR